MKDGQIFRNDLAATGHASMSTSPFDLSGRIALVTGSSRGIGFGLGAGAR